jgi:6-phosphogluconolactonase
VHHELRVFEDPDALAAAAATWLAEAARTAVGDHGGFTFAVSGGRTPWQMFAELAHEDVPWQATTIFQVDERVVPAEDPDRNLHHLVEALAGAPAEVEAMPVEDTDPAEGAARYAAAIPEHFDVVHLGLGPDGHTASLVPGDAVLEVTDRLVAPTAGTYQGDRRMTLTYPALARARKLLWLVAGEEKADALAKLMGGETSIPAGRVTADASLVMADAAAAAGLGGGS